MKKVWKQYYAFSMYSSSFKIQTTDNLASERWLWVLFTQRGHVIVEGLTYFEGALKINHGLVLATSEETFAIGLLVTVL